METIFIGKKELKSYIIAGIRALNKDNCVKISARGKNCQKAIDVAEILKRGTDYQSDVTIGSEKYKTPEGKERNVSTIEIILK